MRSSKSRSRNKSNRQRSIGNVVNRVFDSNGPEGKVRGTPQQIIEKYLTLARDAQLSNDRVAEQNFLQHAEHYTRMLGEAQRELAREQEERQRQNQNNPQNGNQGNGQNGGQNGGRERADPPREGDAPAQLPEAAGTEDEGSTLVETPEARSTAEEPAAEAQDKPKREKSPRSRRGPRKPKEAAGEAGGAAEAPAAAASDTPAEGA
jgi:hypothetical protein